MGDFRSFRSARHAPAQALEPIIDGTAWSPESLRELEHWSYRLSAQACAELVGAAEAARRDGTALEEVSRENFRLGAFGIVLSDVRRELLAGRGIVMLRGFPTERLDRRGQAIAYLGLGAHLGRPISQNREGHILGHVKDLGGDYADPNTRGYLTRAEMRFHSDSCDYVGLLCLAAAKRGGESRVASSITVYNRMLDERPDLAKELCNDLYRSRSGEANPGEAPW